MIEIQKVGKRKFITELYKFKEPELCIDLSDGSGLYKVTYVSCKTKKYADLIFKMIYKNKKEIKDKIKLEVRLI